MTDTQLVVSADEDVNKERITPWVDAELVRRLRDLARRNRRTLSAETEIAIERHLSEEESAVMPR